MDMEVFMKRILIICLLPFFTQAAPSFELMAGSNKVKSFDQGSQYAINYVYLNKDRLGFELGTEFTSFKNASNLFTSITLPYAGIIQEFKMNRIPFILGISAGFGLIHITPGDYGNHYLSTYLKLKIKYHLSKQVDFIASYKANYGKTILDNQTTSFDSGTVSLGLGYKLNRPKPKKRPIMQPKPPFKQAIKNQRKQQQRQGQSSTYQQAQKLMNDLSWPTY
jgi:hypothetical protein